MAGIGHPKPRRETEIGPEAQCSKCREWWPADTEFFGWNGGYMRGECNACRSERNRESKRKAA